MNNLFLALFLLASLGLVVGLIKPSIFKFKSRKAAGLTLGGSMVLFFILFGVTAPPVTPTTQTSPQTPVTQNSPETPAVATNTAPAQQAVATTPPAQTPIVVQPKPVTPAPQPVPAPAQLQTVMDISGSGSKSTQSFTVGNSWQMQWSYNCAAFGSQGNFVAIISSSDGSFTDNQGVNQLGMSGSDTEYYHSGGTFYLQVNSECSWHINVQE